MGDLVGLSRIITTPARLDALNVCLGEILQVKTKYRALVDLSFPAL